MTGRSRKTTVPLGRFLACIDGRIATMPAEELREVIMVFAESLEASERAVFLERFGAAPARPVEPVDVLLADVELLEEEAGATGEPGCDDDYDEDDWSYDDEVREPSWAEDLMELLRRTGAVFSAADPPVVAHVYERLFSVAGGAKDNGWSVAAGPGDADVMREAAARYLRAVGESGERGDRPDRLRRAVSLAAEVLDGDAVPYADVEGARTTPPAGREALLADWVSALGPLVDRDGHQRGSWAHRLLLEVVEQLEGLPGLAELARRGGPGAGRTFLAWFDAARRQRDDATALVAGEEGLRRLAASAERAILAERMAVMADGAGRFGDAVAARAEAWRSAPSLGRLLAVVKAARQAGLEEVAVAELAKGRPCRGTTAPLRAVLLTLGGRLDKALEEVREGLGTAGSAPSATGALLAAEVLVPVLLVAGTDATRCDGFAGSVIAGLLDGAGPQVGRADLYRSVMAEVGEDDEDDDAPGPGDPGHDLALGDLLTSALDRMVVPAAKRRRYLEQAASLVERAVARTVESKDRRHYSQAAALAVAHAEAVAISEGRAAGDAAASAAQSRYPRHVAYRSELVSARTRSPLLTSPPRPR
jgi:hypothetical protein